MKRFVLTAVVLLGLAVSNDAHPQGEHRAGAILKDQKGNGVGTATLEETPNGIHLRVEIRGLPPGIHALHIHEKGQCEGDFTSAGGHFNPTGAAHGFTMVGGPHLGDMPNIHVPENGGLIVEYFLPDVRIDPDAKTTVLGKDGTAIVVHEGPDDYKSQPSGAAGARLACGVIERRE